MARAARCCDGIGAPLFNDMQFVAFKGEDFIGVGFGEHNLGRQLIGPSLA